MAMKISEYFKKIRKEQGYNIVDFASILNISHTHLRKIEKGCYDEPSPLTAARICNMLDLSPEDLKTMFDFDPADGFTELVADKIGDLDPEDFANPITFFYDTFLESVFPDLKYSYSKLKYSYEKSGCELIESNQYSNECYMFCKNKTTGNIVKFFFVGPRKIRTFNYLYDSLSKNLPDFINSFIHIITTPVKNPSKIEEYYFITTSLNVFNEINKYFPHPIPIKGIHAQLHYIDVRNSDKHEALLLTNANC